MNIEFESSSKVDVEKVIQIQKESTDYLRDRLFDLDKEGLLGGDIPKSLSVTVQNSSFNSNLNETSISVISIVSLVYESTQSKPLFLEQTLDLAISKGPKVYNFSFTDEFVSFRFKPTEDDTQIIFVEVDNSDEFHFSEIALIAATSILSIMLVVVSGVLLHITGGWSVCKNKCINCLFEEVDDDFVVPYNKNENQSKQHPTYEEEEEEEEISVAVSTSPAPTSASGFLGANTQQNSLAALGIKTPARHDMGSTMTYDDDDVDMTPMSEITNTQPLGITSMRKMPLPQTPEIKQGFAGLIKQRFASQSRN
jgi:hypothetical protein